MITQVQRTTTGVELSSIQPPIVRTQELSVDIAGSLVTLYISCARYVFAFGTAQGHGWSISTSPRWDYFLQDVPLSASSTAVLLSLSPI